MAEAYDSWHADELTRQQLATVVRDDILSLSRFLINRHRFTSYLDSSTPGPAQPIDPYSSPPRPSTVTTKPSSNISPQSRHRPTSVPENSSRPNKITLVPREKALDGTDHQCQVCAKSIIKKVICYLDSADVRFEVAERLLLLAEQEAKDAAELTKYKATLEAGGDLQVAGFSEEDIKGIKEKKKARIIENFLRNLQISKSNEEQQRQRKQELLALAASLENEELGATNKDDDNSSVASPPPSADKIKEDLNLVFYDSEYFGLFNANDVKPLFHKPLEKEDPATTKVRFNPFITKMYRLVSKQSEPEEAIVDVLDKVRIDKKRDTVP